MNNENMNANLNNSDYCNFNNMNCDTNWNYCNKSNNCLWWIIIIVIFIILISCFCNN
ncbi:MAG: hypothetical protein IKV94_04095 [Clostridia bacterium]|nr:hypothetical protein [Clostridia bacterium]